MYLNIIIGQLHVTALLDTGSAINIMSKSCFDSLAPFTVVEYVECHDNLLLANNQSVTVSGTANIKLRVQNSDISCVVKFYILEEASHPVLLGMDYLQSSGLVLDFSKGSTFSHVKRTTKIKCHSTVSILPNSEYLVVGKLSKDLHIGMQGITLSHAELLHKGLILAKCLVTCTRDHLVLLRVMNPGNETVHLHKGMILATFQLCDNSVDIIRLPASDISCSHVSHACSQNTTILSSSEPHVHSKFEPVIDHKFMSEFDLNPDLSVDQQNQLYQCLYEHKDVFMTEDNPGLGHTTVVKHRIHLKPDAKSKHQRPYRLPPDKKLVLRHQLDELLDQGIIAPVSETENVPITSPIVLVAKRHKPKVDPQNISKEQSLSSYRFCCDFRYLNSQTQDFRYTIPDLQELTESFSETSPNYITSLDLSSGFFQMSISEDSTKYTAFNTCYGSFKFLRLPQGLRTAPNSFQLLMDKILHGLTFVSVLCYLDDICIFSDTFDKHVLALHEVLSRLQSAGLKLKPKPKCHFAYSSCVFLGHSISKEGIIPPSDKLELIRDYPTPTCKKELQRALGLFNWFRKYIPNYSSVANPLYKLMKKNVTFIWSKDCELSFQQLKTAFVSSKALAFPRFELPFRLAVDTSSRGIGYMLYQIHENDSPKVVRFGSKGLSKWQQSYGPTKLELLGLVTSVLDCASYLRGHHFIVECDHQALKPLFQKQLKGAIYDRWLSILQQFDFDILYKPAAQMAVPDAFSRYPSFEDTLISSPDETDIHFPYVPEKQTCINLVTPDAQVIQSLPSINSIQILSHDDYHLYDADTEDNFIVPSKHLHKRFRRRKLLSSSNELRKTFQPKPVDLPVIGKTKNSISPQPHTGGILPTAEVSLSPGEKSSGLSEQENYVPPSSQEYSSDPVEHPIVFSGTSESELSSQNANTQPSEVNNQTMTALRVNMSDSDRSDNELHNLPALTLLDMTVEHIKQDQDQDSTLIPLKAYLTTGELPQSQKLARAVLVQHSDFVIVNGILFHSRVSRAKRSQLLSQYQLVLPQSCIPAVLTLFHDSPLAAHGGIQDTLDRVREHYFFPSMTKIVSDYVQSCHACQSRKVTRLYQKNSVVAYPTPTAPFSVWQIDLYGPLPVTPRANVYIFTALCMFSKYLFAVPIRNKDAITVAETLFQLFTTFGVCDCLLSDRGSEFTALVTSELCNLLQVPQQFSPSFVHHCMGAVERSHATLAARLTPYMNADCSNWDINLHSVVFAMNNAVHAGLGYSPFEIVFAQRPKFPLVISPQVTFQTLSKDVDQYLASKLKLLTQIREHVHENLEQYQERMIQNTNAGRQILELTIGDYVYVTDESGGPAKKLRNHFKGPYVVEEVLSPHLIKLKDLSADKVFPQPFHIDRLKMAYVRHPQPLNYYGITTKVLDKTYNTQSVQTDKTSLVHADIQHVDTQDDNLQEPVDPKISLNDESQRNLRPKRNVQKPLRYRDSDHVDPCKLSLGIIEQDKGSSNVKRVLAQRHTMDGLQYLVQLVGEPAQNAVWVHTNDLQNKTKGKILNNPPPTV